MIKATHNVAVFALHGMDNVGYSSAALNCELSRIEQQTSNHLQVRHASLGRCIHNGTIGISGHGKTQLIALRHGSSTELLSCAVAIVGCSASVSAEPKRLTKPTAGFTVHHPAQNTPSKIGEAIRAALNAKSANEKASETNDSVIEEVIVTATKRASTLQDVSIEAVTEDTVVELGVSAFEDFLLYLPAAPVTHQHLDQNTVYIRRSALSDPNPSTGSGGRVYPDGTYVFEDRFYLHSAYNFDIRDNDLTSVKASSVPQSNRVIARPKAEIRYAFEGDGEPPARSPQVEGPLERRSNLVRKRKSLYCFVGLAFNTEDVVIDSLRQAIAQNFVDLTASLVRSGVQHAMRAQCQIEDDRESSPLARAYSSDRSGIVHYSRSVPWRSRFITDTETSVATIHNGATPCIDFVDYAKTFGWMTSNNYDEWLASSFLASNANRLPPEDVPSMATQLALRGDLHTLQHLPSWHLNRVDRHHRSALHIMAMFGDWAGSEYLLNQPNVDVWLEDAKGRNSLDCASYASRHFFLWFVERVLTLRSDDPKLKNQLTGERLRLVLH
jgi:hypothetical protein